MTAIIVFDLGGQFALSAPTPQSPAPLRSAGSLRGNRYYGKFAMRKIINNLVNKINQRVKAAG